MITFLSQLDDKDFLHYADVIEKLHSYGMTKGNTNVVKGVDEVGDGQRQWSAPDQRAKVQSCLEVLPLRRQGQEDEREKCDQTLPPQQ